MQRDLNRKNDRLTKNLHKEKANVVDKVKTEIDPMIQMAKRDFAQLQVLNQKTVESLEYKTDDLQQAKIELAQLQESVHK